MSGKCDKNNGIKTCLNYLHKSEMKMKAYQS